MSLSDHYLAEITFVAPEMDVDTIDQALVAMAHEFAGRLSGTNPHRSVALLSVSLFRLGSMNPLEPDE